MTMRLAHRVAGILYEIRGPAPQILLGMNDAFSTGNSLMRLTLRTLLAYLDDILEPSQAKEIGDKVNESSFASSLVSRIREVMRRRRLTAPTVSGPGVGIDPNTIAEYLDNTLPP